MLKPHIVDAHEKAKSASSELYDSSSNNAAVFEGKPLHRIMMDDRPGTEPWIFFTQERGGTWVNWDNYFFLWIGDHLILLGVVVMSTISVLGWLMMKCAKRLSRSRGHMDGRRVGLSKMAD